MVIGQNCQSRAACEAILGHPSPHGLGHLTDFRVGVAFKVVVTLKFNSGVVWPPLRALDEAVVKSWHRVVGKIYLKSAGSWFARGAISRSFERWSSLRSRKRTWRMASTTPSEQTSVYARL